MKNNVVVLMIGGLVSLLWGGALGANQGAIQKPSNETHGIAANPTSVRRDSLPNPSLMSHPLIAKQRVDSKEGLFSKGHSRIPAALSSGETFKVNPNPVTGIVKITYRLEKPGMVEFTVSDAKGHMVRKIIYPSPFSGLCRVLWDGKGDDGKLVTGGAYSLKMTSPDGVKTTQFTFSGVQNPQSLNSVVKPSPFLNSR